jgi:A/G-specific adenine glycosylase
LATVAEAPVVHERLLDWYASQARDLPWRRTRDPYAILVAEVMLQQTQVDRVIPHWHAWLERFPTFEALAQASRAEAIRAWHGLGYNLRALRLHEIAIQVVTTCGGRLPAEIADLLKLKGIGRYTAGAVACFAFEQPVAMVDTNVRRVLGRVFEVSPEGVDRLANDVVPTAGAYAWNQALMDLGAMVCRARAPLCLVCPLLGVCRGPLTGLERPSAGSSGKSSPGPSTGSSRGGPARRSTSPSAKPSAAFRGSARFYRGRLVDRVRALAPGETIALDDLVASVAAVDDRVRVATLTRRLAAEGLLRLDADQRVALPD